MLRPRWAIGAIEIVQDALRDGAERKRVWIVGRGDKQEGKEAARVMMLLQWTVGSFLEVRGWVEERQYTSPRSRESGGRIGLYLGRGGAEVHTTVWHVILSRQIFK